MSIPTPSQPSSNPTWQMSLSGLRCQSCALRVEKALSALEGVERVEVSYATERASIWGDGLSFDVLRACVQRAGYGAHQLDENKTIREEGLPFGLWLLLALVMPFVVGMVGMMWGSHALMLPESWQMVLAWGIQSAFAYPFYRGAWLALKAKTANMDTLVALGTSVTLIYSTWAYFGLDAVYFEASAMVVAFVRLGKHWEEQTKRHSLNALSSLLQLRPSLVNQVTSESALASVSLAQIRVGDVLRARAGERVGADGLALSGEGLVDESHLTGEPELLRKRRGDSVLAGSLVVEGTLDYRVNKLGKETILGDLMQALERAQNSQAPIARLADKVASWFVPCVVGIAVLTFGLTLSQGVESAWVNMAAVLVVACPCALGLATPASLMAGLGQAVKKGVWFRDGAALEQAARVDCVVLDKTGTLTVGRPQVIHHWLSPQSALDKQALWRYVASLEIHAKHPVAGAMLAYVQCEDLAEVSDLRQHHGAGIEGIVEGHHIKLGTVAFVGHELPIELETAGQTVVLMSVDKALCAVFGLADAVKDDAKHAVQSMQALGIEVMMLSGDRESAVVSVAQALGISHYVGEQSPRDKAEAIKAWVEKGSVVAMVGDGVNDVAALSEASCGMAFYAGAEAAHQVAEVRLMQHEVSQVYQALWIARQTLRNIRQNLGLAMVYNSIMLPLAALGYLTPALAGISMALSSVMVLFNALRLKRMVF